MKTTSTLLPSLVCLSQRYALQSQVDLVRFDLDTPYLGFTVEVRLIRVLYDTPCDDAHTNAVGCSVILMADEYKCKCTQIITRHHVLLQVGRNLLHIILLAN